MVDFTLFLTTHKTDLEVTVVMFSGHYAAVIKRSMEYLMKSVKTPNKIYNLLLGRRQDKICIFQRKVYSKNTDKENKKV